MPDRYKQETKVIYTRAESIVVNNCLPANGLNPSMRFNEEYALVNEDGTITSLGPAGTFIAEEFCQDNANTEFNLVDSDDNIVGTATYADVHQMLRSLYKYVSIRRDNTPIILEDPIDLPPDWPTMNIDQPSANTANT